MFGESEALRVGTGSGFSVGWHAGKQPCGATPGGRQARKDQGEQGRMDLLTVLMHEVGHLHGQEHEHRGLMGETLATGVRLNPDALDADEVLPAWWGIALMN